MLPSLLSLVLIIKGYQFINEYIGHYVNWGIIRVVAYAQLWIFGGTIEEHLATLKQIWIDWYLHFAGFVIAISLIYFVGIFLASFIGRWIWRFVETFLNRTPVVGQIYPHVKQVTDFFFSDQQRWDSIGAYGQRLPTTPHLDRLASEGVLFEIAFTCQPVCGPARACLQRGRYATETGCVFNGIALPEAEPRVEPAQH